jgi:hypothetical protein
LSMKKMKENDKIKKLILLHLTVNIKILFKINDIINLLRITPLYVGEVYI